MQPEAPVIFLAACAAGSVDLESDKSDTAADGDADTDTDADSDTDADTDTGEEFVPETDWAAGFVGWRNFYFESNWWSCDDTVDEVGEFVEEDSSNYEDLSHACGDCTYFFEVTAEPDSVCDGYLGITNPSWRGVAVHEDGSVTLYLFREGDGGVEEYAGDDEPTFDDVNLGFYYFYEVGGGYGLDITGEMTFQMTTEE